MSLVIEADQGHCCVFVAIFVEILDDAMLPNPKQFVAIHCVVVTQRGDQVDSQLQVPAGLLVLDCQKLAYSLRFVSWLRHEGVKGDGVGSKLAKDSFRVNRVCRLSRSWFCLPGHRRGSD